MRSISLSQPIRLSRPWPTRWLDAACELSSRLWRALVQRRRNSRDLAAALELSEATLRDIGAPDELLLQAAVHREAQYLRAMELRLGLGRGAGDRGV